jgi:hypothetical protein
MPSKQTRRYNVERLRNPPSVTVPGTETAVNLPDRTALAWYAGLAAMATLELIEWPFAVAVAGTHLLANHAQRRDVQELCEGIEAGI